MTSADWIGKVATTDASRVDDQLRGIRVYGDCYDARTNRLAASLGKAGKAPRGDALKDFEEFEAALKEFTAKALGAASSSNNTLKSAYASLYEKQFRYAFYQSYAPKPANPGPDAGSSLAQKGGAPPTKTANGISAPPPSSDTNDVTKAKNRFGELLGGLPEDKLHEIHEAFAEILGPHPVRGVTQLAVYRYAIFLLEPSSAKPFSPPPF